MLGNLNFNFWTSFLNETIRILNPAIIIIILLILFYSLFYAVTKLNSPNKQQFRTSFCHGLAESIMMIIQKLPAILLFLAVITGINIITSFATRFYEVWENQQRIKELTLFVKNLSNKDEIAQITVLSRDKDSTGEFGVYKITTLDGVSGNSIFERIEKVYGKDIRLDSMVINFDYSEIGAGKQRNLAFPYRIFSEKIPASEGIILDSMFTNPSETIAEETNYALGLSIDTYRKRAEEFINILKDPVITREMGINSEGNANTIILQNLQVNEQYTIYVTGTGGLTYRKSYNYFLE